MDRMDLDDLSVEQIMEQWPDTIRVFMQLRIRCIGCPVKAFHTLRDAAKEHGVELEGVTSAMEASCARHQNAAPDEGDPAPPLFRR